MGKKEEILAFQDGEKVSVASALRYLTEQHGKRFSEYIYKTQSSEVKGYLQFFVNGQSVVALSGLETVLADGDILAIVPPVGGG